MTDLAINCEGLGKRYSRSLRSRTRSFREALTEAPSQLISRLTPASGTRESRVNEIWALRDLDLEIPKGTAVGVIGRNGAGKSTLLKIIAGVTRPTEGSLEIAGRVGSLLEVGAGFHSELTGRENIRLYGAILGMKRSEIAARFDEIVAFSDIGDFLDTPVKRYSSGMYMRLAFAVASHLDTEILLVDEVLAVGDAGFQRKCLNRVDDVSGEGRTVFFVSHNLQAVQRLCSHSMILHNGRLVAFGQTSEMIRRYLTEFSTGSSPGSWIRLDDTPRTGTGKVKFTRVRYNSGSDDDGQPASRRSLVVEAEVFSEGEIEAGSFAVIAWDRFGAKLINADTALYGQRLSLKTGANLIRTEFPRLGLSPGPYALGLWIARGTRDVLAFDYIEQAAWFDVIDPDSPFFAGATNEGLLATDFVVKVDQQASV